MYVIPISYYQSPILKIEIRKYIFETDPSDSRKIYGTVFYRITKKAGSSVRNYLSFNQ